MKKILFLITLAGTLCAPAHAQQSGGDWETGQQVQIKCARGHAGCTLTHENETGEGGIQDRGGNSGGTTGTDIDQLGGGTPPPTGGTGNPPANTGSADPVLTPPNNGGSEDVEAQSARYERERIEKANSRIEQAKESGDSEELRRAMQELTRAQNRMRSEMNRKYSQVRAASSSTAAKFNSALKAFETWQKEMIAAGLKKEVVTFYVTNQEEIEQLLIAFGDKDNPGPLRWLAANQEAIESMKGDYEALDKFYAKWQSADGKSYTPLMKMAKNVEEIENDLDTVKKSLGSEWWVKVLAIVGPILAIFAFLLRKK